MKAVCIKQQNSFDPEVGSILEVEDLEISLISRGNNNIEINNPLIYGTLLPKREIINLLQVGDVIRDNYCHGQYVIF